MTRIFARLIFFAALGALAFGLLGHRAAVVDRAGSRDVYLAGGLSDTALVTLGAAVSSARSPALLLIDSPGATPYNRAFLSAYEPGRVFPVGRFDGGRAELERRLDVCVESPVSCDGELPPAVLQRLYPGAVQAVVCPAAPRGQLLQAACLAGTLAAPLFVADGGPGQAGCLKNRLAACGVRKVIAVGNVTGLAPGPDVTFLADGAAAAAARLRELARRGRIATVIVANASDAGPKLGGISALAPMVALRKNAPLLLTNAAGSNAESVVLAATRDRPLRDVDSVVFVAGLAAVPMAERPNPIAKDKDPVIEMEPLTPRGTEPFSFATGRLFHEDPAVVALLLARPELLARPGRSRRALVASNPGGGMDLLEAFSRNTVQELRNAGYETTAVFGKEVNGEELRRILPEFDVFLWEGHHNPLIVDYGFARWDEPLPPAFVFLQSCLALKESKAGPLLSRGAVGVVGSSTRTYSASGGACSLAFFDALLYDGESLGGALRQSKNFLLAYSLLKEKRLGGEATRAGANLRSAWAFTLWGDPTLRLPRPEPPADARPPVRHEVRGDTVVLHLPAERHEPVTSAKYHAEMMPNARLAGLLRKGKPDDGRSLVPFVFAEVHLPDAEPGRTPRLHSRLSPDRYVFCWDARRACGYLLAAPGPTTERELRFRVEWRRAPSEPKVEVDVGPLESAIRTALRR